MFDFIQKIGSSIIHHGKNSNRIYLMSLDKTDLPTITQTLEHLAEENEYTKIIAKIPDDYSNLFLAFGYKQEAFVPKLYNGKRDGCFMCKYLDKTREIDPFKATYREILKITKQKSPESINTKLPEGLMCRQAEKSDIPFMTALYKQVFKSYPFPIHEEDYLLKTMDEHVIYYGLWHNDKLAGLSSIEMDKKHHNAEMTDFAVLNEYRGSGFALFLLEEMEKELGALEIKTAYTIARAKSPGINITFAKKGYAYAGTLINNTDISGQIESMNVWYKHVFN